MQRREGAYCCLASAQMDSSVSQAIEDATVAASFLANGKMQKQLLEIGLNVTRICFSIGVRDRETGSSHFFQILPQGLENFDSATSFYSLFSFPSAVNSH